VYTRGVRNGVVYAVVGGGGGTIDEDRVAQFGVRQIYRTHARTHAPSLSPRRWYLCSALCDATHCNGQQDSVIETALRPTRYASHRIAFLFLLPRGCGY